MKLFLDMLVLADGVEGEEIKLLPWGQVDSARGTFYVDAQGADAIIQAFDSQGNDGVVDYEHQTLKDVEAPAAGWIKKLIKRAGDGLYGVVEWTDRAKQYLANKEYRYLSPVVLVSKSSRKAMRLHSVGLTNTPAIAGMEPLVNSMRFEGGSADMDLRDLVSKQLGLTTDVEDEQITQAIGSLQEKAEESQPEVVAHKDVLQLLDLAEDAKVNDVKGAILALKNPSGFVSVEQFNQLKAQLAEQARDDLVARALEEGKVAPAQREWAETYALKDPDGFQAFLDKAPVVVPLEERAGGDPPKHKPNKDDVQTFVNKQLEISDEDWEKYGSDEE